MSEILYFYRIARFAVGNVTLVVVLNTHSQIVIREYKHVLLYVWFKLDNYFSTQRRKRRKFSLYGCDWDMVINVKYFEYILFALWK